MSAELINQLQVFQQTFQQSAATLSASIESAILTLNNGNPGTGVTPADLAKYALKTELSGLASKEDVAAALKDYALKSEFPDTSVFATATSVAVLAQHIAGSATKLDLQGLVTNTSFQASLADTKAELAKLGDAIKAIPTSGTAPDLTAINTALTSITSRLNALEAAQAKDDETRQILRAGTVKASAANVWTGLYTSPSTKQFKPKSKITVEAVVYFPRTDFVSTTIRAARRVRVLFGATKQTAYQVAEVGLDNATPSQLSIKHTFIAEDSKMTPADSPRFYVEGLVSNTTDLMEATTFNAFTE